MLQKKYRLPAFQKLFSGSSFSSPYFFLRVAKNSLGYNRFGFVIGKKTENRATARNRIRRVFRSCVEEMREEMKQGLDFLFVLKSNILELERKELYNELYKYLSEKNLLK